MSAAAPLFCASCLCNWYGLSAPHCSPAARTQASTPPPQDREESLIDAVAIGPQELLPYRASTLAVPARLLDLAQEQHLGASCEHDAPRGVYLNAHLPHCARQAAQADDAVRTDLKWCRVVSPCFEERLKFSDAASGRRSPTLQQERPRSAPPPLRWLVGSADRCVCVCARSRCWFNNMCAHSNV